MEHDIPKLLKAMMDKGDWNQTELAHRISERRKNGVKADQSIVSRWLKGVVPETPRYNRIIDLATEMGVLDDVRSEDVAEGMDAPFVKQVKIKGYVGAGAETHFYALADEDFTPVDAPAGASDQTIAVEIRGKSWGPQMDGWLVFYDDIRSPITEDLIGKPCVVGLADDRILLKTIKREGDGSYTLLSNSNDPPIVDAVIEWAAKVIGMRPR